jgi:hypothetical protein
MNVHLLLLCPPPALPVTPPAAEKMMFFHSGRAAAARTLLESVEDIPVNVVAICKQGKGRHDYLVWCARVCHCRNPTPVGA